MSAIETYAGLEPRELWRHFGALNGIPRRSGKEEAARAYVRQVAAAAGSETAEDAAGNLVVRVPASPGCAEAPAVVIQAHLDMVCEKRPEVAHDFDTDPIRPRIEGDWVYGSGTTLGSDNGIGAAAALAALTGPGLEHGPLELLFTVEEETGLHGARGLDPSLIRARLLINLDSEDPRELTVGCAGGAGAVLRLPAVREDLPAGREIRDLVVSGLKGGHSGVQIHERLANAIKLLTRALLAARDAGVELGIAALRGGNAHNAIPRDAAARLAVPAGQLSRLEQAVARVRRELLAEWQADEPNLALELQVPSPVDGAESAGRVLAPLFRDRLLSLLDALPHGVLAMSDTFPGKVETSANLAQIALEGDTVTVGTSSRSFITAELEAVQARIAALGEAAGARIELRDAYPGWEPDRESRLLRVAERVYEQVAGQPALVEVIHAGLECGVIVSKLPGMEAISFGPRIEGAHTPEERVCIPTVLATWKLLTALLAELCREAKAG